MYSVDHQVASWCHIESSAMVSPADRLDILGLWQVAAHTIGPRITCISVIPMDTSFMYPFCQHWDGWLLANSVFLIRVFINSSIVLDFCCPLWCDIKDLHSVQSFSYVHLHASTQNSLKLIFHFISLSRPLISQAISHFPLFHTYTKLGPPFYLHKADDQGTIWTSAQSDDLLSPLSYPQWRYSVVVIYFCLVSTYQEDPFKNPNLSITSYEGSLLQP